MSLSTATASGVAAAAANTASCRRSSGTGPAVAFTRATSARSAAGTSERSVASHAASDAASVSSKSEVGGKHRVEQAGREERGRRVPVDAQPAVLLVHLVVEPRLRRLRDAVHHVNHVGGKSDLRLTEHAREDHRQEPGLRIPGAMREQALHLDAAHRPMVEVGGQLPLLREGARAEAPAHGAADFERRQIREDAEHRRHIGMQHAAVAYGEIQREVVAPGPGADHFGIRRQQHRGRRQSPAAAARALSAVHTPGASDA